MTTTDTTIERIVRTLTLRPYEPAPTLDDLREALCDLATQVGTRLAEHAKERAADEAARAEPQHVSDERLAEVYDRAQRAESEIKKLTGDLVVAQHHLGAARTDRDLVARDRDLAATNRDRYRSAWIEAVNDGHRHADRIATLEAEVATLKADRERLTKERGEARSDAKKWAADYAKIRSGIAEALGVDYYEILDADPAAGIATLKTDRDQLAAQIGNMTMSRDGWAESSAKWEELYRGVDSLNDAYLAIFKDETIDDEAPIQAARRIKADRDRLSAEVERLTKEATALRRLQGEQAANHKAERDRLADEVASWRSRAARALDERDAIKAEVEPVTWQVVDAASVGPDEPAAFYYNRGRAVFDVETECQHPGHLNPLQVSRRSASDPQAWAIVKRAPSPSSAHAAEVRGEKRGMRRGFDFARDRIAYSHRHAWDEASRALDAAIAGIGGEVKGAEPTSKACGAMHPFAPMLASDDAHDWVCARPPQHAGDHASGMRKWDRVSGAAAPSPAHPEPSASPEPKYQVGDTLVILFGTTELHGLVRERGVSGGRIKYRVAWEGGSNSEWIDEDKASGKIEPIAEPSAQVSDEEFSRESFRISREEMRRAGVEFPIESWDDCPPSWRKAGIKWAARFAAWHRARLGQPATPQPTGTRTEWREFTSYIGRDAGPISLQVYKDGSGWNALWCGKCVGDGKESGDAGRTAAERWAADALAAMQRDDGGAATQPVAMTVEEALGHVTEFLAADGQWLQVGACGREMVRVWSADRGEWSGWMEDFPSHADLDEPARSVPAPDKDRDPTTRGPIAPQPSASVARTGEG